MINIQYTTLNMKTLVNMYMSIGTKISLTQKRYDLKDCNRLSVTRNEPTTVLQGVYQIAEIQTYPPYPKTVLENKTVE